MTNRDGSPGIPVSGVPVPAVPRSVAAVGVAALALLAVVAGATALGVGPFGTADAPSVNEPGISTANSTGTGTDAGDAGGAGDGGGGDAGPNDPDHVRPFAVVVESVDECGRTCRDVTASLTNDGGNPRSNVTATTQIVAGEETVWEGSQEIGTLGPDETATRTARVEIGLVDAARIERNDGVVTIVTVVRWDGGSATYRERRTVA